MHLERDSALLFLAAAAQNLPHHAASPSKHALASPLLRRRSTRIVGGHTQPLHVREADVALDGTTLGGGTAGVEWAGWGVW